MEERIITIREALNEALRLEMRRDPSVIVLGEDVAGGANVPHLESCCEDAYGGVLGVTKGLMKEFTRARVIDTPISESAIIGSAVGAALTGLRPVAELMFIDFLGVCLDQITNQAGKFRYMFGGKAQVPMVVRMLIGAGFRAAAQHSGSYYAVLAHYPGLKVVVPSTPYDAKGLLISAIRDPDPVMFCEHKMLYGVEGRCPEGDYTVPIGKADVKRAGKDATVVAIGRMVYFALEAAEEMAKRGKDIEVIDLRSISPLDEDAILDSVKKTHRLVVVDEDNPRCSVATDIVALVSQFGFDYLDAPPVAINAPHTPVPFSPVLEDAYIPNAGTIIRALESMM
jgi:acetoin:2,6-dichlorophenolindophenol oxidoreductase subunit beta